MLIDLPARFNRLAWGYTDGGRDLGVLVAGMENGEMDIWDPSKIVASAECVLKAPHTRLIELTATYVVLRSLWFCAPRIILVQSAVWISILFRRILLPLVL